MYDLHSHILYGIDDGARTIAESFSMLESASRRNIKNVVATPHFDFSTDLDAFLEERDSKIDKLKKMLQIAEIDLNIYGGAEVLVTDDIFFMNNLEKLTLNNSRYLLIEFEFKKDLSSNRILSYIDEIKNQGIVPVIAHPERYYFFQKNYDLLNHIAECGAILQVNATSFLDDSYPAELKLASALVSQKVASVIASDAHSFNGVRSNKHLANRELYPNAIKSDERFDWFVKTVPHAILNNLDIPKHEKGVLIKKLF